MKKRSSFNRLAGARHGLGARGSRQKKTPISRWADRGVWLSGDAGDDF